MSPTLDVVTLGEAMLMLVADEPGPLEQVQRFHKRTAGAETNVAIGLARLGLRVGWGSRLGTDSMGRYLLAAMQREGIDCSHVELTTPTPRSGFQFKGRVDDGSDPPVEYHRKGSAASRMTLAQTRRRLAAQRAPPACRPACFRRSRPTASRSRGAPSRVMREAGRSDLVRPQPAADAVAVAASAMRDTLNELARSARPVLPGVAEGLLLTGSRRPEGDRALLPRARRDAGGRQARRRTAPTSTTATRAAATCRPSRWTKVVDTVGAGDGFAVGVVSALLEGRGVDAAARRGAWIGARAVQVLGDTEGLPTRAQLEEAGL